MLKIKSFNNKLVIAFDEITSRYKHMFGILFSYILKKNIDVIHIIPSYDIALDDCIRSLISHNILKYKNNVKIVVHVNLDSDKYHTAQDYYNNIFGLVDIRFSNDRKPIYFRIDDNSCYKFVIGNEAGVSISKVNKIS